MFSKSFAANYIIMHTPIMTGCFGHGVASKRLKIFNMLYGPNQFILSNSESSLLQYFRVDSEHQVVLEITVRAYKSIFINLLGNYGKAIHSSFPHTTNLQLVKNMVTL